MKSKAAAAYLGVSETKLRGLPITPRRCGGNVLFDRADLDAYADALPYDQEDQPCHDSPSTAAIFGVGRCD